MRVAILFSLFLFVGTLAERNRAATMDPEELEQWTSFFTTHAGGSMPYQDARSFAMNVLQRSHPDLEQLKTWATFLRSYGGGSMYPIDARKTAWKLLQGTHPKLEDWRKWAEFFRSPLGGTWITFRPRKSPSKFCKERRFQIWMR
mmetsp:Transcript_28509/g.46036  ORF Transcript_28509/g.46036 Transcript_28509/m.46036 type:complete len:145 (+) Transcript_28509:57-491(+)